MSIPKTISMLAILVASTALLGGCHAMRTGSASHHEGAFRHVVVFKYTDVPAAKIKEIETAFNALPSKINVIKGYEWGLIDSVETLDQGYTHGYILTFASKADCKTYIDHPDHKAFVELLKPLIGAKKFEAFVFDYVVK